MSFSWRPTQRTDAAHDEPHQRSAKDARRSADLQRQLHSVRRPASGTDFRAEAAMTEALAGRQPQDRQPSTVPAITLPKGGGAIRGIGEKFAANPVTGTGSMTVPIATSPGRGGFGPQLALSYDSGSGNGPFGFGWSLGLPCDHPQDRQGPAAIPRRRRIRRLLAVRRRGPRPRPREDGGLDDLTTAPGYADPPVPAADRGPVRADRAVDQHQPTDEDVHWRSWSQDNLLTLYGKDATARIYDPADPSRIFSLADLRDPRHQGQCRHLQLQGRGRRAGRPDRPGRAQPRRPR